MVTHRHWQSTLLHARQVFSVDVSSNRFHHGHSRETASEPRISFSSSPHSVLSSTSQHCCKSVCVRVCVNVSAGCSGAECSSYFNLPFFCHAICFLLASLHFIAEANWQMRTPSPRVHVVWCTLHRLLRGKDRGKTSANHSCVLLNIVALAAIFGSPSHCSRAAGFFLCFS